MGASAAEAVAALHRLLPREFYARSSVDVARDLLGKILVSESDEGPATATIVETEAYGGPDDLASHARAGLTKRTAPMFGPPGHAYVYLVYGMHECLNVVTEEDGRAGAVLLRAGHPLTGIDLMRRRRARPGDPDGRLAAGPARLAQALAVTRADNGHDLTLGRRLWVADPGLPSAAAIEAGPRIGISYAGAEWAGRPWRFWLRGEPAASRP
ncbi:MAG TPA: DNA-3-methyladenine glycosylase [Candidatus Limnocylindrales bacterium]|jgi:DNA-3-methyladenine glycosylase|nr:DNA-3-methyladenine glycosylase [Candidatus Limnocylindrales bacterium]